MASPFDAIDADGLEIAVHRADAGPLREAARQLVRAAYSRRGYRVPADADGGHQTTIVVCVADVVVATATVGFDGGAGLKADLVHKTRIDAYRLRGARVCEITGLASARGATFETVLPLIFHRLFVLTSAVYGCTDIFIEVHPRHRRFYETRFGFQCLSPISMSPRVNAPAYLLQVSTERLASLW